MIVTVAVSGESDKAIVVDVAPVNLEWLMANIVQPLQDIKSRDYAGALDVYEGDVTHKCSEEQWCEKGCYLIGSVDYDKNLKSVHT